MIRYRQFSRELRQRHWLRELGFPCILILLVLWNYYAITRHVFLPQDFSLLAHHSTPLPQLMQSCQDAPESLQSTCSRPLSRLFFFLASQVWQWGPRKWHSVNLLLHLINVIGVYALGRAVIGSPTPALVAGSVFALHPGQLETLLPVAGVMDLAGTACILLSVLSFLLANRQEIQQRHALWYRVFSLILYGCAILLYEPALFLPAFLLFYELTASRHESGWQRCRRTLPYFLVAGGLILMQVLQGTWGSPLDFSLQSTSFLMDVRLLLRPVDALLLNTLWGRIVLLSLMLFAIAGVLVSKVARFAILWTGGFLLSAMVVSSASPGYLALCGLSLLIGEILAGTLRNARFRSFLKRRHVRTILQTSRIIVLVLLCIGYGFAIDASKTEWHEVASSTEHIPLFLKSLHPAFPEDAQLCFDTLPSGSKEDWKYAIRAKYPDWESGNVQIGAIEHCIKEGHAAAIPTYAFRYQPNVLSDITRKVTEEETVADIEDLARRQDRILSKQHPQLVVDLRRFPSCRSLGLVSSVGNGQNVSQGTVIARGYIERYHGQQQAFTLAAGADTAEWALRFSTVAPFAQHSMPPVYAAWIVHHNGALEVAQNYLKTLSFGTPIRPKMFALELSAIPLPDQFSLDVRRIICYQE